MAQTRRVGKATRKGASNQCAEAAFADFGAPLVLKGQAHLNARPRRRLCGVGFSPYRCKSVSYLQVSHGFVT
jgi:hypothetical protein